MKMWLKVMRGDKILRDLVYEGKEKLTFNGFREALQSATYALDVSTPVLLRTHFRHFEEFRRAKFTPSDFIEEVDFTALVAELVPEEDKPSRAFR